MNYERQHQVSVRFLASVALGRGAKGLVLGLLTLITVSGCGNPFAGNNQPQATSSPIASPTPFSSPTDSPSPLVTSTSSPGVSDKPEATRNLETQLQSTVSQTINAPLQAIDCPPRSALQGGERFDCQATTNNQSFVVSVAITDASGQFEWQTKGLVQLPKLEQFIQQQVREKGGGEVKAACGGTVRIVKPGDSFDCQVTNAQGQSRTTRVTVKDDQGTVDVSLI
jgi:hypothetical protein